MATKVLVKKMANIQIKNSIETIYCDCCGSYDDEYLEIFIDGKLFKTYSKDGHFGNSWFMLEDVYKEILEYLGNTVSYQEYYI